MTKRFGRLFERVSPATGRELRIVDARRGQLLNALFPTPTPAAHGREVELLPDPTPHRRDRQEAV